MANNPPAWVGALKLYWLINYARGLGTFITCMVHCCGPEFLLLSQGVHFPCTACPIRRYLWNGFLLDRPVCTQNLHDQRHQSMALSWLFYPNRWDRGEVATSCSPLHNGHPSRGQLHHELPLLLWSWSWWGPLFPCFELGALSHCISLWNPPTSSLNELQTNNND